jgi:hypothetical protein
MMWRLLVLFFVLGSCERDEKPSNLIAAEKMENVLWDMLQADRYANAYLYPKFDSSVAKVRTIALYESIFRKHGINKEQFADSYRYYMADPARAKPVFDSISANAEKYREKSFEPMMRDTLK